MPISNILAPDNNDESLVLSGLIDYMVHQTPSLSSLGREELKAVAKGVIFDDLKADLKNRVEIEKINYKAKRQTFIDRNAKKSAKSAKAYSHALDLLELWADRAGISVLEMKATHADAYIDSLEGASSTVRLRVAACSSFFTFLERETDGRIRNPFRGTRARPKKQSKVPEVPTIEELEIIKAELSPTNNAAVIAMMEHGFRVGALGTLVIWGGKYTGNSKGKEISGLISTVVVEAIKEAGLDSRKPWANLSEDAIRNAFKYASGRLYKAGKIKAAYSVHDIRHYFAIHEYLKDKDIYRLKMLLGHASIQVTETYLKGVKRYWS